MIKIEKLKGSIVMQSEITKTEKGRSQLLHFRQPGINDDEGNVVKDAEIFPVWAGEKAIEQYNGQDIVGKKVEITCFLNSAKWEKDDKNGFNLSLRLASIAEIIPQKTESTNKKQKA